MPLLRAFSLVHVRNRVSQAEVSDTKGKMPWRNIGGGPVICVRAQIHGGQPEIARVVVSWAAGGSPDHLRSDVCRSSVSIQN